MHRLTPDDDGTTHDAARPAPARGPAWGAPRPTHTLVLDGVEVAGCWVATTRAERTQGLLGTQGLDGALWLRRCANVHTFGMRYALDVVVVTRTGRIRAIETLAPRRASRPRPYGLDTVEMAAGRAAALGMRPGQHLALRPAMSERGRP